MCAYVDGNIQGLLPAVDLSWQCSLPPDLKYLSYTFVGSRLIPSPHSTAIVACSTNSTGEYYLYCKRSLSSERIDDRCGMRTGNEATSHKVSCERY